MKNSKILFLLLTIIAGIIIFTPRMDFHFMLSSGDHGRDLYSFKKTYEGAVPYRDYWTQNGPLMPYYYSLFYRLFGVSIQSTVGASNFLVILTGIIIYFLCLQFLSPQRSFICSLWYWFFRGSGFFYTFNHVGAMFLMIAAIYCLFHYINNRKKAMIYVGAVCSFLIIMIRPNIGAAVLASFFLSLAILLFSEKTPQKGKAILKYLIIVLIVAGISSLIYWQLTRLLPNYVSSGDLNYTQHARINKVNQTWLVFTYLMNLLFSSISNQLFLFLVLIATLKTSLLLRGKTFPEPYRSNAITALRALAIFIAANGLEFFFGSFAFRLNWIIPLITIFFFFVLDIGFKKIRPVLQKAITILLLGIVLYLQFNETSGIIKSKQPQNRLQFGSSKIYLPQQPEWIATVTAASDYIMKNIPPEEKIIAIPYDPIYSFLADRDFATRELSFFFINGPKESDTLREIEEAGVEYVLISSRAFFNTEMRFGRFGDLYGKQLFPYIAQNFKEIATFGPWGKPAGWVRNHSVKIFRRK